VDECAVPYDPVPAIRSPRDSVPARKPLANRFHLLNLLRDDDETEEETSVATTFKSRSSVGVMA